jgi:AbrB family looped-hinge helix DNA binding protein
MATPHAVRVDAKGRLLIPQEMRSALDIHPGDTLFVEQEGKVLRYAKADNPFDLLAEHALREYEAGKTKSLRDCTTENNIVLDDEKPL